MPRTLFIRSCKAAFSDVTEGWFSLLRPGFATTPTRTFVTILPRKNLSHPTTHQFWQQAVNRGIRWYLKNYLRSKKKKPMATFFPKLFYWCFLGEQTKESAMRTSPPQLVLVVVVHQPPGVNNVHQSGGQETVVPVDAWQPLILQLSHNTDSQ